MNNKQKNRVTMFYDGGCPLCAREVAHYRRLDRESKVHWQDIDNNPGPLAALGVKREDAMRRLHVLDRQQQLVTGAQAFRVVWKELPYYRLLAWLTSPGWIIRPLDFVYQRFAAYRYKKRARCTPTSCS